ncbi:hypothetical protein CHH65_13950 [Shouchella clausii]|uniref:hypothetical protein n=1 Tax=Shouchella TaxID=2893057 RepID=UPI000BA52003|nr:MULTISPECIES: hypothetical protein [Shouchella]PAF08686.1 hypothetical protein CHH65_13950 [Shouchella clausii]
MSQKYNYGRKKDRNPDSKYAYDPEKLDDDIKANIQRIERKRERIKRVINEEITSEPTRMEETFSLMIDVLREKKKQYGL